MCDELYDERYDSGTFSMSWEDYHDLEDEMENQREKISNLEDDVEYYKNFIKKFIEEGNKKEQTLEEAYAKTFEFYVSEGYDEDFKKNKK